MPTPFDQLLHLEPAASGRLVAPVAPDRSARTYGGQFLAHTLRAAQTTVENDRAVHSLHCYFLRAGDVDTPTELEVEHLRDGRSFSQRQVTAYQQGVEMFSTLISFHTAEQGLAHQPEHPFDVPGPEEVTLTYHDVWEAMLPPEQRPWPGRARPMDIRYINPPTAPEGVPILEPQLMWMRIREPLDDDPALHAVGLAYLADATLVDHVTLPHGFRWQDERLTGASLDHAMWFHQSCRADEWLLYDQRVEFTGGARGLASGRFYTADGTLVATCMQEGLMRWADA